MLGVYNQPVYKYYGLMEWCVPASMICIHNLCAGVHRLGLLKRHCADIDVYCSSFDSVS